MDRQYYLDLAAGGLRMPVGAHLVLHDHPDAEAIAFDGYRLGEVVAESARRYRSPLAVPLMDLMIEKAAALEMLDIPTEAIPTYHFTTPPTPETLARLRTRMSSHRNTRLTATVEAIRYVAQQPGLLPIGMVIGPFSLMVRFLANPIMAVFQAGRGRTAAGSPDVALVEGALDLAIRVIEWSLRQQIAAGAKAIFVCEPAANTAYLSPRHMDAGSDVFDRYVMHYHRRVKQVLDEGGADLIFHCCGEVTPRIIKKFTELDPVILSLGSPVKLWEVAPLVPKTIVLFGNLPTKKFFSDREITDDQVRQQSRELLQRMRAAEHPFILGSECDVLSVPGHHEVIKRKVDAFMNVSCDPPAISPGNA